MFFGFGTDDPNIPEFLANDWVKRAKSVTAKNLECRMYDCLKRNQCSDEVHIYFISLLGLFFFQFFKYNSTFPEFSSTLPLFLLYIFEIPFWIFFQFIQIFFQISFKYSLNFFYILNPNLNQFFLIFLEFPEYLPHIICNFQLLFFSLALRLAENTYFYALIVASLVPYKFLRFFFIIWVISLSASFCKIIHTW